MQAEKEVARQLLREFRGPAYTYGTGCFGQLGPIAASQGHRASIVTSGTGKPWGPPLHAATREALDRAGIELAGDPIPGPRPNAPKADVIHIAESLSAQDPEVIVAVGGGSLIDATKAAVAAQTLRPTGTQIDDFFGVGEVSQKLAESGRALPPIVAVQIASGSAAHLTKYANVTDDAGLQKYLIVDEALVPPRALFDYATTTTMPAGFTMDGALDGIAHCIEVLFGAPPETLDKVTRIALTGVALIVSHLKTTCIRPGDLEAREAVGLGTDLGGHAIMVGGTNGAHLTSFSLVDILPHGRACAIMNPYYAALFAPAIEDRLRPLGALYADAGYSDAPFERLRGRDLGITVAEAMQSLSRDIGFPTTLSEVPGFSEAHLHRALAAAKQPKLEMKLRNMPIPLSAETVETHMRPVLEAAATGDFSLIPDMEPHTPS